MAAEEDYLSVFKAHFNNYRWSIPFYGYKEECGILAAVMKGRENDQKPFVWGLDQEFAASFRMLFDQLENDATTEHSKAVAHEYATLAYNCYKAAFESKDFRQAFYFVAKPEDFIKLIEAFKGLSSALQLIDELEETAFKKWLDDE